jgi:hypothetical protein
LLLVIPEDPFVTPQKYTIVGYYLSSTPSNALNPDTRDLMRYEVNGVLPSIAGEPASIDLNSNKLSGGKTSLVAKYIDTSGFKVSIWNGGTYVEVKTSATKNQANNKKASKAQSVLKSFVRIQ